MEKLGVEKLTDLLGKKADTERMLKEAKQAEIEHEYTFKAFGWSSIPLRSLGGMKGPRASDAHGEHLSNDSLMFKYTSVADSTPYLKELMEKVAGKGGLLKARL